MVLSALARWVRAIGHILASGGARVVTTVAGRSERTQRLADGLELLPTLDDVVGESAIVLSVVPSGAAMFRAARAHSRSSRI